MSSKLFHLHIKIHLFLLHCTMTVLRVILFFLGTLKILIYWFFTSTHAVDKSAKLTAVQLKMTCLLSGSFITFSSYLVSNNFTRVNWIVHNFFLLIDYLFIFRHSHKKKTWFDSDYFLTLPKTQNTTLHV